MVRTGTARSKSGYEVPTYELEAGETPRDIQRCLDYPTEVSRTPPPSSAIYVSDDPPDRVVAIAVQDGAIWYVVRQPFVIRDIEVN